ncbi:hypothetical protein BA896_015605 [Janthinobacterium lividum]|uniref:Uncharacterized protein n=1 Tax=Janthinobacterium lividum TaxID=29581 RepID=A0A1E8PN22_9BURK|nr:hypothetical protein BA896_015605 [Janthinobacterium lividum]
MMTPLMLPSVPLPGDRIARLNLVAAAGMLAMASLLLIFFQLFSLQTSLQRNLLIQAEMLAPAATRAMRQDDRLAAQLLLAPLAAAPISNKRCSIVRMARHLPAMHAAPAMPRPQRRAAACRSTT